MPNQERKTAVRENSRSPDTIDDFGKQWTLYTENRGYYGSKAALDSLVEPLLNSESIRGKRIADIGAGTGRYARLFHEAGANAILAMEPSQAFEILKRNTADLDGIDCLKERAEKIPALGFDIIFCIGVLQFIPDPRRALIAMGSALRPGGRLFLWVYGKENNALYLMLVRPLRIFTSRLPGHSLRYLAHWFLPVADLYAFGCRFIRLPLSDYLLNYFSRLDLYSRKLVVYDQLNPRTVKYYSGGELRHLLKTCGFVNIRMHHRLGYSWSVLASYKGGEQP